MQDITTIDIIYGNFDYMTIFPPSKKKYFSPWVINNCCILINKWNFKEIYCNNIETIPRINDPNYRFVVIPFLENRILPSSLPHIKQIEEQPKFTFFQKIHRKYFFPKEQKERELSDFTEQYGNSFLSNFRNLRAISPYVEGWNESPHAINYLCCNYEIVHKTTEEKEFSHFGNEGFLKLDSFVTDMIKPNRNILDGLALKKMKTYLPDKLGGFLTFHLENCPYPTYYFIEMITDYSEILYFNSETSQNINCQLAFKEWLNNTVKSKKLNCQKFSELVKSKLTIETSDQAEENEPKVKPSIRAIALYHVFRIEKGIELPFDKRTPNKTKAIETITNERKIDNSTFRKELKIVNNSTTRKNIKYKEDYKQAIQLLDEDRHINKEAIILAKNELKLFAPLG